MTEHTARTVLLAAATAGVVLLAGPGAHTAGAQSPPASGHKPVRDAHQPDGQAIEIYFRGHPDYAWYEDRQGFSVVRELADKAYYYAQRDQRGDLVPDKRLLVGRADPAAAGLKPGLIPSPEAIERRRRSRTKQA